MRKKEPEHPYSYKSALFPSSEKQPKAKKHWFGLGRRKKKPEPPAEPPAEEVIKIVGDDNSVFIVDLSTNKLYYVTTITDEMGREVEVRRQVAPTFLGLDLP
jgi:hypothetical protein